MGLLELCQEAAPGTIGQHDGIVCEDHKPPDPRSVGRFQEELVHLGIGAQVHITLIAPFFDGHGEHHRMAGLALDDDAILLEQCRAEPLPHQRGE